MNIFLKMFYRLRLRSAIIKADEAAKATGHRMFVLALPGHVGKLRIVSSKSLYEQAKARGGKVNFVHLTALDFYHTPYPCGSCTLSPRQLKEKRKAYYKWIDNGRKHKS